MGKIFVTTYTNPDLDGVACAVAYSELLDKRGMRAEAGVFGEINDETGLVMERFRIDAPKKGEALVDDSKEIVLVDVSSRFGLSNMIELARVTELIDHHKLSMGDELKKARLQIELVGAAATLVGERFLNEKVDISQKSACLLYYAIISNTINLKNSVTTSRDVAMADWLSKRFEFEPDYTEELFRLKSRFKRPVEIVLSAELARQEFNGKRVGISQVEIVDTAQFIRENPGKIKEVLGNARKELDFAFLSCVDIKEYCNRFVVADKESRVFAESLLGVRFRNDLARRNGILMRKEIWPLVKQMLEGK